MEFRQLRCFVTVAEELHFGRSAFRLGITQPALSRQIQRFEHELGAPLFERTRRSVRLTPAGEALLPRARAIVQEVEEAERATRAVAIGSAGRLRVGFVGSAALSALPIIVRTFTAEHPAVALELRELTTAGQLAALKGGAIDVGLVRAHPPEFGITSRTILREPLLAAVPAGSWLSGSATVSVAQLRDEAWVMFPRAEGSGLHEQILTLCRAAGYEPTVAIEALQMQTLIGLVAAGMGVALVPSSATRTRLPGVVYRPLTEAAHGVALLMAWRETDASPLLARFRECVNLLSSSGALAQTLTT